jgi:hypothetical protein
MNKRIKTAILEGLLLANFMGGIFYYRFRVD